jgi:hypothetical protein
MIDPRTLADSMLADDQAIIDATSKAHEALAAWAACPPIIRRAYLTEASRLAGRGPRRRWSDCFRSPSLPEMRSIEGRPRAALRTAHERKMQCRKK